MTRITKNQTALAAVMWASMKVAMLAVVMLWAGFGLQRSAAADHKIVVIADPHVMAPELLTNPGNADWTTYLTASPTLTSRS